MKKVLVLSDNYQLIAHFKCVSMTYASSEQAQFEYFYSETNKDPSLLVSLGLKPINIKSEVVLDWILRNFDLIFSLHCKQIFPGQLVKNTLCINVHPGLNPFNRGWYPQVFSIINGYPAGATIHIMDHYIDHGNIIDQQSVPINPEDTSLEVYNRVIKAEKELITKNLDGILNRSFGSRMPLSEGNYNSLSDFKKLCALDLNKCGTLKEHIDLLRALSHADFKNAFFIIDGKRYYVTIKISCA